MAIIADILTQVDAAATAVGATAFDAVAAQIVPVFRVGSVPGWWRWSVST